MTKDKTNEQLEQQSNSVKILVINGHGAKLDKKIRISNNHSIITPGAMENSYLTSFDNQERHLEEMTSQNKLWPIKDKNGQSIQWHQYKDAFIHDVEVMPLQENFNVSQFSKQILDNKTGWNKLTNPPHDVLERGALAVKLNNNKIVILEHTKLKEYLVADNKEGTPLFFCDKELGKVKPLTRFCEGNLNK